MASLWKTEPVVLEPKGVGFASIIYLTVRYNIYSVKNWMICVVWTLCCWFQGADQCSDCRKFKNGTVCVSECSPSQYPNEQDKCANCDAVCDGGCTGPGRNLGAGGCRSCLLLLLDSDGSTVLECVPESALGDCFNYTPLNRSKENAVRHKVVK